MYYLKKAGFEKNILEILYVAPLMLENTFFWNIFLKLTLFINVLKKLTAVNHNVLKFEF